MRAKEILEKLGDLATFLTLAGSDAGGKANEAKKKNDWGHASFCEGKKVAFTIAFENLDRVIKEAKR